MGRPNRAIAQNHESSRSALVAVADSNVWHVREWSELLQESGSRVLLLTSSSNALQVLAGARCDVVLVGTLAEPSGPELCLSLRDKLGPRRPWFVRVAGAAISPEEAGVFDVGAARPVGNAELVAVVADAVRARRAALARPEVA